MRSLPLLAAFALLTSAGAAYAHPKLLFASPAANATVAPTKSIELKFSESLVGPLVDAELTMTDMPGMKMPAAKIALKPVLAPDHKTLTLVLAQPLAAGGYALSYHVTSTDTHRVAGGFAFHVK